MSEHIRESLSAVMDGEASQLETDRLLGESSDPEVRAAWVRYHAVRHAIRNPADLHANIDLSGRIMAAIEAESAPRITSVARWANFLRPVASFAVAASVFAAVLVGSQFSGLLGDGEASPAAGSTLAQRVSTVGMVSTLGGSAVRASYSSQSDAQQLVDYDQLARQRLQRYILPHAEEAALNAPQGMMPYARVASFQTEE